MLREFKNLSQENVADELNMSVAGYGRIERNEVDINIEKLEKLSHVLGVKPEDIISFDESALFKKANQQISSDQYPPINIHFQEKIHQLYEDKIKLLEDKIMTMQEELNKYRLG